MKNQAAVALGKLGKGIPKNYSQAELQRRRERMKKVVADRVAAQQQRKKKR